MAHNPELCGVHGEDRWRGGQDDVAEPHEGTAESLDDDQQGHEQEALPQARRRTGCTRLTARGVPGILLHGAERVTQARTAHEACRPDPRARPAHQPWMSLRVPNHRSVPSVVSMPWGHGCPWAEKTSYALMV